MATPPPELVLVSGMSGAGRSAAADVLEDLGWFVVDNLPPELLPTIVKLVGGGDRSVSRIAVVVDVRSGSFFAALQGALEALRAREVRPMLLFLEASDEVLVRRYESVRRPHPLQGDGRVLDGIAREREALRELRGDADLVIDTSNLNVHQLAAKLVNAFGGADDHALQATIVSFGYKYGIPVDADLVVDCRFLPNPYWEPELRGQTGLDPDVRDYVLKQDDALPFLDQYESLVGLLARGYLREGKRFVTIAVGCTGGKHRSVAMAEELGSRLRSDGIGNLVLHRDLGRE
ncbi:RNase adapter RapZ [Actinopolymorpha alba]|uniref:RNase adapter RapZ n=1 Tax=Actinopolymorpha alba TaxID=533267 RepID=UPI000362D6E9|nr:RNase adapter RapZ [Actinopolymorpha alba]